MLSFARPAVLVSILLVVSNLTAAPAPAPSKEEIARWIQQMGDGSFTVREEATKKLWQVGRAAEAALREATKNDDAEIVRRARELLDKFKWGIYADTPPKVVELIERYQSADAATRQTITRELFDQGSHGCAVLVKIAGAEENADLRRNLLQQITVEAGRVIPTLLAENNFTALEELLELSVAGEMESAIPSYTAYHVLRGKLDERIAHWKPLAEKGDKSRAAEVLSHLHRAKGDMAAARQTAEKANRADLFEAILFEQRDWKELAKRRLLADSQQTTEALGMKAAVHRLAGIEKIHRDELEAALADLRKQGEQAQDENEAWLAAKALALNDRPQEALAVLTKGRNLVHAFEILNAQMKYREALELADKVPEGPERAALDVLRARTLHLLGEKDKAREIFAKLGEQLREGNDTPWQESLIQWEWRLGLKEQALDHCARALPINKNTVAQSRLLEKVFPKQGDHAWGWWRFLRQKHAAEDGTATLKRVQELLAGKLDAKTLTALAEEAEQAAAALPPDEQERTLQALAEACRNAALDTPARGYLEKAAAVQGATAALIKLGDFLADKKLWEQAAEQYGKAWEKDRKDPLPLYLRGWALVQGGLEKEGKKAIDLAHWLPLGNEYQRYQFADALNKRGQTEAARRERDLLLRISTPGSFYAGDAFRQLGIEAYQKKDYARSADYQELAMLRVLKGNVNFVETAAYVGVPHFIHRLRARGLLMAGKVEEARREIDVCLALQPGNVDLAIMVVPELEKLGHRKEADELVKQTADWHEKVCKAHPESASSHNSIAWLLALCRRQLDQALEHANKAVQLAPDQAGYIDTLAEVHFQRGDKDRAMELMKKCIELEPKRGFFRKQLKRFEAGDPKAEVPSTLEDD